MAKLAGKTAIVTGASKGIGAAIAERLAADGAAVVVNYSRSAKEAESVVSRIHSKGGKAIAVRGDIARREDVQKVFDAAEKEFGKVDILVNNAGVYDFRPIEEIDENFIDKHFSLNVKGLLFASSEAAKRFNGKGGSIVNISSVVVDTPPPNSAVYSSTKGAVDIISKSLAAELGPKKIRVNSVSPGFTVTEGVADFVDEFAKIALPRTPLGRAGKPDDIADAVSFVVSDEARWITGQTIGVTGGLRL